MKPGQQTQDYLKSPPPPHPFEKEGKCRVKRGGSLPDRYFPSWLEFEGVVSPEGPLFQALILHGETVQKEESPISNQSERQARAQRYRFKNPNSVKRYDQIKENIIAGAMRNAGKKPQRETNFGIFSWYYELGPDDPPYAAKFYDCCGAEDPEAPGCTTDFHISYDDE
nr:uncharacterized protein LOC114168822 isoform X2 [Ipomoea batatas]